MRRKYILALSYFSFLSLTVAESTFLVKDESYDLSSTDHSSTTPVCYSYANSDSSTKTYYTSVEKALDKCNSDSTPQTIVVLVGVNPTIKRDCTIGKGDTLRIPYDDALTSDNAKATETKTAVVKSTDSGLKSTLYVASGVILTNKGTLQISGKLSGGNGGAASCGHTCVS